MTAQTGGGLWSLMLGTASNDEPVWEVRWRAHENAMNDLVASTPAARPDQPEEGQRWARQVVKRRTGAEALVWDELYGLSDTWQARLLPEPAPQPQPGGGG